MTREQYNTLDFEELMEVLNEEYDNITTRDMLKEFIKIKIDEDDWLVAKHVLDAMWDDPQCYDVEWWDYDYSMGTLDTPVSIKCKEDIEHLIDD